MESEQNTHTESKGGAFSTPVAIVIAGLIIAGALVYNNHVSTASPVAQNNTDSSIEIPRENPLDNVSPISDRDHVRGNRDAKIMIVEYSDFECPFCKRFHNTMKSVFAKYGNEVAWVYRHFPLEQLHPVKAQRAAVASECAYDQGGDEMFWAFTDMYYDRSPANNRTDQDTLFPEIVREIGLDATQFATCLDSGKHDALIKSHYDEAVSTGGRGTPWSIIIAGNGDRGPINGAQELPTVEAMIEIARQRSQ